MSEWWTYHLSDFLMFSPRTYGRLVEMYNRELWPGPLLALALGLLALALAMRGGVAAARAVAALLALAWAWVAWAFFAQRYATIFLAAPQVAAAFGLQALLFVLAACAPGRHEQIGSSTRLLGVVIAGLGLVAYPLLAPALGRTWTQAEVFGWMPDPTALTTLGLVLVGGLRLGRAPRWLLMLLPALALLFGVATQWELSRLG